MIGWFFFHCTDEVTRLASGRPQQAGRHFRLSGSA